MMQEHHIKTLEGRLEKIERDRKPFQGRLNRIGVEIDSYWTGHGEPKYEWRYTELGMRKLRVSEVAVDRPHEWRRGYETWEIAARAALGEYI